MSHDNDSSLEPGACWPRSRTGFTPTLWCYPKTLAQRCWCETGLRIKGVVRQHATVFSLASNVCLTQGW